MIRHLPLSVTGHTPDAGKVVVLVHVVGLLDAVAEILDDVRQGLGLLLQVRDKGVA